MGERYEIKDQIGQGGLGAVYRAFDSQLKRDVALKRLLPPGEGAAMATTTDNLLTEATTLSALQHPNIVTVYDVGADDGGPFVVMELLKGETFDETVERGALTEKDFRGVVAQTMEALVAAHHNDIVHRDLKPSNLMVNWLPSGKFQIKILDFGLAKFAKEPEIQTVDHGDAIMGSIYFMAPEQFERAPLDARTDLYSIGALYHYCLTGQYPFTGETAPQVMAAHLQHRVQPLHELRPDLPRWMCDWVMWLISRQPGDRPESAKQALDYFNNDHAGRVAETPAVPGAPPPAPVAPTHAAPPPPPPPGGAMTAPLSTAAPAGIPAGQLTGPLTPGSAAAAGMPRRPKKFPMPVWAMITIPVLLIALLVVYLSKSGAKRAIEERNQIVKALNEAETPRGDAQTVATVIDFIKGQDGDELGKNNVAAALTTLQRMVGSEVDAAILNQVDKVPAKHSADLLAVVVNRRYSKALPSLLKYLEDDDEELSRVAVDGLAVLGSNENIATLLEELEAPSSEAIGDAVSKAVIEIARKDSNLDKRSAPVLAALSSGATDEYRHRLLEILGHLGGDKAWVAVRAALTGADKDSCQAALRGLASWPDGKPAEAVFKVASDDPDPLTRGLALRAYVYLLNSPSGMPEEQKAERISQLLKSEQVARRTRIELLGALASMATPVAQSVAGEFTGDRSLGAHAKMAVEEIGNAIEMVQRPGGEPLLLRAADAQVFGESGFKFDPVLTAIVGWTYPGYYVAWPIEFSQPGKFEVVVKAATPRGGGGDYVVTLGPGRLTSKTPGGDRFVEQRLGEVEITEPGTFRLSVTGVSANEEGGSLMQLRSMELRPL